MKKTLLVILLIASVITGAFAADTEIMLGLQSGFNEQVIFPKTDYGSVETYDYVPIKADAMFYFGDSFALNAALGMDIYTEKVLDTQVGMVTDVLAYYRYELSDMIDILAGGGISYKMAVLVSEKQGENSTLITSHQLALLGSVRFQFDVIDHLTVFAGADIGYNVLNATHTQTKIRGVGSNSTTYGKNSIMPWAIKAGVSYKF